MADMKVLTSSFLATREAAFAKLFDFLPRAGRYYSSQRNYDEGPGRRLNVSELSPYISRRIIAESEVISAVLAEHHEEEVVCQSFLREVLWRSYWRSYLEQHPSIWRNYCQMLHETSRENNETYLRTVNAQSGIEVVDSFVLELKETGYLHNHARLWLASLWIHALKLPWQWGAAWFLENLLDGDPASNTLSWRWVAGLHTKGKRYIASAENISKFTLERFKVELPPFLPSVVSEEDDHQVIVPSLGSLLSEISQEKDEGLLIIGDDLSVEQLHDLKMRPIRSIAIVSEAWIGDRFSWNANVRQFHKLAIDDAKSRFQKIWPNAECITLNHSQDHCEKLLETWHQRGIQQVLVPLPHVGPYQEVWQSICSRIQRFKIGVFSRRYDEQLVGLGKKGFFDFWDRRPKWKNLCSE